MGNLNFEANGSAEIEDQNPHPVAKKRDKDGATPTHLSAIRLAHRALSTPTPALAPGIRTCVGFRTVFGNPPLTVPKVTGRIP